MRWWYEDISEKGKPEKRLPFTIVADQETRLKIEF